MRELKIKECLDRLGIENFLPMHYEVTGTDENRKMSLVPAIHNLIFVRTSQDNLTDLKTTRLELEPLRYMMRPDENGGQEIIRVPDGQMNNFIRVASVEDDRVTFLNYDKFLSKPGTRVEVLEGFFAGVEGVIRRIKKNKHVVVQIDGVAAVAIAYVPAKALKPM